MYYCNETGRRKSQIFIDPSIVDYLFFLHSHSFLIFHSSITLNREVKELLDLIVTMITVIIMIMIVTRIIITPRLFVNVGRLSLSFNLLLLSLHGLVKVYLRLRTLFSHISSGKQFLRNCFPFFVYTSSIYRIS